MGEYLTRSASSTEMPTELRNALSPREREILQLLAEGKTNKEVAALLGISLRTAEPHRGNLMKRLRIGAITDLVRYAIQNEIIRS